MNKTLTLFPNLFVNKMIKKWMNKHIKFLDKLSNFVLKTKSPNGNNVCGNRKKEKYFESC